jgi:hypothetical protein
MSDPATAETPTQTSHEQDGKVLTGIGDPSPALLEHIDRRAETADAPTPAQADAAPAAPIPAEPQQTRGRQRFSDLTKERDAARAETTAERTKRETLEREVTDLRARVQQASTPQQAAQAQTQLTQAEHRQTAQPVNGQRFQFPSYDDAVQQYPQLTYDEWSDAKLDAHANWREQQLAGTIEQRIQAGIQADRQQRTQAETHQAITAKGRAVYKDYDAAISAGPGAAIPLAMDQQEAVARCQAILRHPRSEHLQYAIASNADLARRMQQATPYEFGALLAEIAPEQVSRPAALSSAPAPFQPVGTGSATAIPSASDVVSRGGHDFDKSGWRERRDRELGRKRA